jgi:hypothetical protein
MHSRFAAAILVLAAFAPLACSKEESKSTATSDLDAAAPKKRFEPDPLGTVPPMDTSEPEPPPAVASAMPSGSGAPLASAAPSSSAAKGAAGGAPGGSSATTQATVRLIDPGAEPRAKLRYKFKVGQSEMVQLDLQTTATVEAGGQQQQQKIPLIRIGLAIDPKSISPEGDLRYEYRVVATDIANDPSAPQQFVMPLRMGLEGMKGVTGWAIISPRGITKDAGFPAPRGASQQTTQIMEQIKQTARELATPFPDEAIGKGAKWEKTTKVDAREAKATQKETYTLVDLGGDKGKVEVVTNLTSPGAKNSGEPIRLEGMTSTGKGGSAFDLARIAPTSTLDATTVMNLIATDENGDAQKLKMTTRGIVKVAPAAPAPPQ